TDLYLLQDFSYLASQYPLPPSNLLVEVWQEFATSDEQWDRLWQKVNTKSWDEEVATQQFTDWSEARQLKKPMLQAEGDWLSATNMVSYYGLDDPGCHPTLSIGTTWN